MKIINYSFAIVLSLTTISLHSMDNDSISKALQKGRRIITGAVRKAFEVPATTSSHKFFLIPSESGPLQKETEDIVNKFQAILSDCKLTPRDATCHVYVESDHSKKAVEHYFKQKNIKPRRLKFTVATIESRKITLEATLCAPPAMKIANVFEEKKARL
jgi:hypothetical protein